MPIRKISLLIAFTLVIGLAGILLTSCAAASYLSPQEVSVDYWESDGYYPAPEAEYAREAGEPLAPESKVIINGSKVGETTLRHVIRNGSIDLTVKDTRETMREIQALVNNAGGIVSNSNIYEMREGQFGAYLTLRVPEKVFDAIMEQLETYGKPSNVQTSADDVTMHYVDLESRLKNQKAQENRLVEILAMAETVEEVLEVERELFRVRGDIEAMTVQLTRLQDQVSYATITLTLREETIPTESISPGAFENFGKRLSQTFIGSINFVMNAVSVIILVFAAILPVSLVLGLFVLLVVLLIRKLSKRKPAPAGKESAAIKKD